MTLFQTYKALVTMILCLLFFIEIIYLYIAAYLLN